MNHPHPNHFFHHVTFQSHQDSIAFPSSIQKLAKYKLNMALSLQAAPTLIQPAKVGSMPGRTGSPHLKPSKPSKAFGFEQAGSTKSPGGFALFLAGSILCRRTTDSVQDEDRFSRRDVLKCFSTIIGMEMIASSGSFTEKSYAADLIQRRQRSEFLSNIKGTFYTAIKDNAELIPSILMLALNDAMTYDKATKSGGPNGSIRFSSEISRPENRGLSAALRLLEEAKKEIDSYSKGGPLTYADLIQFAAQSAVKYTFLASAIRKCGGNEEKGNLLYTAYGSNGQWGLFDRQFGRSDAEDPDPDGRILQWERASVQEMKDKFSAIGFGPRQLAVMSAFLGPDQLATESSLASDPEVLPWVQKYQRSRETVSQTDYEVDLITTLTKLSCLGQQINYEAYTYPVQKVDFSKLKL